MKQTFKLLLCLGLALAIPGAFSCAQLERPPVIQGVIVAKEVPPAFDVSVVCVASSVDGKDLTYEWTADNGTVKGEGNAIMWLSPASPGTYNLAVKVSGVNGRTASQQAMVRVVPFKTSEFTDNPEVLLKTPIPGTWSVTDQVKITPQSTTGVECSVSSNSTGKYKYTWTSNGGKLIGQGVKEGKAARVAWMPPTVAGNYTVTVEVTDEKNNIAVSSVYFEVAARVVEGGGPACGCGH